MNTHNDPHSFSRISAVDNAWSSFIEVLSDEFTALTGFGPYAYLSPVEVDQAYQHCVQNRVPVRAFAREYVNLYL